MVRGIYQDAGQISFILREGDSGIFFVPCEREEVGARKSASKRRGGGGKGRGKKKGGGGVREEEEQGAGKRRESPRRQGEIDYSAILAISLSYRGS